MSLAQTFVSVDEIAAAIPDGAQVAIAREGCPVAMAATRALIRRGARDLHLVCVPTSGIQADLLIGAGCVATIETAGVSLGEYGQAPRFNRAVRAGRVRIRDATCPAIHAALQAGEKGIPFMPLRGIIGSDLVRYRDDWKVIGNPFAAAGAGDDPIVVLPALNPDVALLHARFADREGNVWVGRDREMMMMAHAARRTLVTVEEIREHSLMDGGEWAAGTLPALYVEAVAEAPRGAWPLLVADLYEPDADHIRLYARMAASDDGFAEYLDRYVFERAAAAE